LRPWRVHPLSGDERAARVSRGFRPGEGGGGMRGPMTPLEGALPPPPAGGPPGYLSKMNMGVRHHEGLRHSVGRPRHGHARARGRARHADHRRLRGDRACRDIGVAGGAEAGIAVPKLCATDSVEAFGSCRLCVVEIEGRRGTPASCTTPVAPGMVVRTQSDKVRKIRRGVMELYISDHPLDCLTCAANGDCELQDMAGAVGLRDVRYEPGANHFAQRSAVGRTRSTSRRTIPTPISPTIRRSASSARAACGPARRCRAPSR
jgi:hypothetical protein